MELSDAELERRVRAGDSRGVARLLTLCENRVPRARKIQAALFNTTGRAHVIGVTGSPGAGKSTLVDQLAMVMKEAGRRVAVLAIDPSSPFSGGAVLGDRIRMTHSAGGGVFIRSMATRGFLGGLAAAAVDAVHVLDAAGYDIILIETVGVGQAEVDIVRLAHSCIVVLVPGMGDSVQALKAGILEIADVFVINKADRDGAALLERDLKTLLSLDAPDPAAWQPRIALTTATTGSGVPEVAALCYERQAWLESSPQGALRRYQIMRETVLRLAGEAVMERIMAPADSRLESLVARCLAREIDPFSAAAELVSAHS